MRLRRNCTGQKQTTRHLFRLAIAMALASGSVTSATATGQPEACPTHSYPSGAVACEQVAEQVLLPYPFAKSLLASEADTSQQLVRVLGLGRKSPVAELQRVVATPNQKPSAVPALPQAAVVQASASQEEEPCVSLATNALVAPACSQPAVCAETESLLDIEIPLPAVEMTPTPQPRVADTSGLTAMPVLPATPAKLPAAATVREPQIIQQSKPMSLTVAAPTVESSSNAVATASPVLPTPIKIPAPSYATDSASTGARQRSTPRGDRGKSEVKLSLSDTAETPRESSRPSVELHLSSSSSSALRLGQDSRSPTEAMQVRIEGEAAPMVSSKAMHHTTADSPTTPLPTFEPAQPRSMPTRPIRATFASRTTSVETERTDRQPQPESQPESPRGMQVREPLSIAMEESLKVTCEAPILETSVEHPEICQLLKTSDRSVSIVGLRPGSTRIALIVTNAENERSIEVHEVTVGGRSTTEVSLPELARGIAQTVSRLYPNSDVQVIAGEDRLLVRGFTSHESDARKIISLIRKTSLTPVVDELLTYGK